MTVAGDVQSLLVFITPGDNYLSRRLQSATVTLVSRHLVSNLRKKECTSYISASVTVVFKEYYNKWWNFPQDI